MNKIKVSVIVPVYNVEKYIKKCLESLINQTLEDIEIIIVNDGTKDNSMKIVEPYLLKNNKIIVVNQENKGLSSARNTGLKIAKGEYVGFVDSDDFVNSTMFEDLYQESQNGTFDIIFSNVYFYNDLTKDIKKRKIENKFSACEMIGTKFLNICGIEVWNKIYKRSFLEKNNLFFKEKIIHEDNLFTLKCFFLAKKVKYINKYHYFYRQERKGSIISLSKKIENKTIRLNSLKLIVKELIDFEKSYKSDNFSIMLLSLWIIKQKIILFKIEKDTKKIISKNKIREIENNLKKTWRNFSYIEKDILKKEIKELLIFPEFYEFNIFNSFYWKNGILSIKAIRRIIKEKIKSNWRKNGNKDNYYNTSL